MDKTTTTPPSVPGWDPTRDDEARVQPWKAFTADLGPERNANQSIIDATLTWNVRLDPASHSGFVRGKGGGGH